MDSVSMDWSFIDSQHAYFSDLVHSPKTVADYLSELLNQQLKHYWDATYEPLYPLINEMLTSCIG